MCERGGCRGEGGGPALVGEPDEIVAEEGEAGVCAGGEQRRVCALDGSGPVCSDEIAPVVRGHDGIDRLSVCAKPGRLSLRTRTLFPCTAMDPDGMSPQAGEPTTPASSSYAAPSHSNIAAVAATVSVVGVLMAVLITWLVVRLRRAAHSESIPVVARRPTSNASYVFRPSFAPSEASSRFGFSTYPPTCPPSSPLTIPSPQAPPYLPPTPGQQLGLC